MIPAASVVIVTKDRKDELRRAIRSCVAQEGLLVEVLVVDDGSADGTAEMVRQEFPSVHLERRGESRGCIVRRNEGARLARATIVFSIDDDAEFSTSRIVKQTIAEFSDNRIGAVAIPYVNVLQESLVHQNIPGAGQTWIASEFVGTAHAIRRNLFLELGGYREHLVHQGEERDLCIRMLAAGGVVRLGDGDVINHYESAQRNFERMDFYGRRNDILFAWQNVPMPWFAMHLGATIFNGVAYAILHARHPAKMFAGIWRGLTESFSGRIRRQPVNAQTYRLHRRLKKRVATPLRAIESELRSVESRRI